MGEGLEARGQDRLTGGMLRAAGDLFPDRGKQFEGARIVSLNCSCIVKSQD